MRSEERMTKKQKHIPVLADEVLDGLNLKPGMRILDGTVGLGGHAGMVLDAIGEEGELIAFDRDRRNLELARIALTEHIGKKTFICDSYASANQHGIGPIDGAMYDLGFSSVHVDDASRGFSFQQEGPLDMRYDITQEVTAESIVNGYSREKLAEIFRVYGEEPRAAVIAKAIFDARRQSRITTTTDLADVIESVKRRRGKQHPATQVFQALRIAVNDELGEVERGLQVGIDLLKPGSRITVLTFHSIEDRMVKRLFRDHEALNVITKKPIQPSWDEKKTNPRARSAKLRVAEKIMEV